MHGYAQLGLHGLYRVHGLTGIHDIGARHRDQGNVRLQAFHLRDEVGVAGMVDAHPVYGEHKAQPVVGPGVELLVGVVGGQRLDCHAAHLGLVAGRQGLDLTGELGRAARLGEYDGVRPLELLDVLRHAVVEMVVAGHDQRSLGLVLDLVGVEIDRAPGTVQAEGVMAEPMQVGQHRLDGGHISHVLFLRASVRRWERKPRGGSPGTWI